MLTQEWQRPEKCDTGSCGEAMSPVPGVVLFRASDVPERVVTLTADEWTTFVAAVKDGQYDLA